MKLTLILFVLTFASASYAQKVDTLRVLDNRLQIDKLREGTHDFITYFEDSTGTKIRASVWSRSIQFTTLNGEPVVLIKQQWHSDDTLNRRSVVSYVKRKNFQPIYHYTSSKRSGVEAYKFLNDKITGVDTVIQSKNKTFNQPLTVPTLNWELDLETFVTLPYAKGKVFALNFYHPGSTVSVPQYYIYTVTGSEELLLLNGKKEDCWKLEINYTPTSKATFYISKKTQDVLKMSETLGKGFTRYKVKIGIQS